MVWKEWSGLFEMEEELIMVELFGVVVVMFCCFLIVTIFSNGLGRFWFFIWRGADSGGEIFLTLTILIMAPDFLGPGAPPVGGGF